MIGHKVHSEAPAHAYKKATCLDNEENRSSLGTNSRTAMSNDAASPRMSLSFPEAGMLESSPFLSCQGTFAQRGGWSQTCGGVGEAVPDFTSVVSAGDLRHHVLQDDGDMSHAGTPAPSTPREVRARNCTTPPPCDRARNCTTPPPCDRARNCTTPPPWTRPRAKTVSPLLRAMERNAAQEVRAWLECTPGIAEGLFLDDAFEPPLCAAVRLKCSLEIFELLIAHGADTRATNNMYRTPIDLLRPRVARDTPFHVFPISPVQWLNEMPTAHEQWHDSVMELLKAGKAKPVG